jgi:hypothetical protein
VSRRCRKCDCCCCCCCNLLVACRPECLWNLFRCSSHHDGRSGGRSIVLCRNFNFLRFTQNHRQQQQQHLALDQNPIFNSTPMTTRVMLLLLLEIPRAIVCEGFNLNLFQSSAAALDENILEKEQRRQSGWVRFIAFDYRAIIFVRHSSDGWCGY